MTPSRPRRLADFLGTWALEREIRDADGSTGVFEGRAVWTVEAPGALCHESGTLSLPGQGRFHAERRYRWDADLLVYFEDGRPFHQVPPMGGTARHVCDPDLYIVTYDFADWPRWRTVWRVTGPRKDYRMSSRLAPLPVSG